MIQDIPEIGTGYMTKYVRGKVEIEIAKVEGKDDMAEVVFIGDREC